MFVDIYSLGQGEVTHTTGPHVFSVRNLQVLYGYRFEAVPKEILPLACGPLGEWTASSGKTPVVEIVHHRQSPLAYPQLPPECKTRNFQKSGTLRRLVPITNTVELAMFAAGVRPYKVDPLPFGKAPVEKKWEVPDLTEEAARRMEEMKSPVKVPPPPAPVQDMLPDMPKPSGAKKDPHSRPNMMDFLPKQGDTPFNPEALDFGPPGPGDIVPGGLLGLEDLQEPEEREYLVDAPTHCQATTARGDPCRRSVKAGTIYCGGHQNRG